MLFFEHNNLTAVEWAAIRRELRKALLAVPPPFDVPTMNPTEDIQLQVLRTRMFGVALRIAEFFDPETAARDPKTSRTNKGPVVHDLSAAAYDAIKGVDGTSNPESVYAQISPYMAGPLAGLIFPGVWPQHLAAALSILSPTPGSFPAPTRRKNPGFYDLSCQAGLAKLRLIGGRIEGQVFDPEGVKWVGGIEGGMEGLRVQLVAILQGAGFGVASTLESPSRSLWFSLETRRGMLEDEGKGTREGAPVPMENLET
jgi:large subunit ribosomal protein L10